MCVFVFLKNKMNELTNLFRKLKISDPIRKSKNQSTEILVWPKFKFQMSGQYKLYDHQIQALKWCLYRSQHSHYGIQGGILSLQMGMGKTLVALSLIYYECSEQNSLFVCNKALVPEIRDEILKFFGSNSNCNFFILHSEYFKHLSTEEVIFSFKTCKTVITTYDTIKCLHHSLSSNSERYIDIASHFFSHYFHFTFFDESQRVKNKNTRLFQALNEIKASIKFCLTGTPFINNSRDIYTQLLLCGLDNQIKWKNSTFKKFHISDCIYTLKFKDTQIKLPKKNIQNVEIYLTENERNIYNSVLQTTKKNMSDRNIPFTKILLMFMKLRQACISPCLIIDSFKKNKNRVLSSKLSAVLNILKNNICVNDKIVIFSAFTNALNYLYEILIYNKFRCGLIHSGMAIKKRDVMIRNFKTESLQILLMTNNIGALGLNLTVANHVMLLEPWWNKSITDQAISRVWRLGQRKDVFIWKFISIQTIEQKLEYICEEKHRSIITDISSDILASILD